jgi:hypothetical protein
MDSFQFYPTPADLAARMIAKFTTSPVSRDARVLEPSAGDGALARALVEAAKLERERIMAEHGRNCYYRLDPVKVDFIEIDMRRHDALRSISDVRGEVIGLDFLQFRGSLAPYTHVLGNPPFADGVHHLLRAWDGLFAGELVFLLNAETVRNPFSKERRRLVDLIDQHGDVEFVQDAFLGLGVEREANVEVAIVHLTKTVDLQHDVIGSILDGLDDDALHDTGGAGVAAGIHANQLAIAGDVIERTARVFDLAVRAMRETVVAQVRSGYFARLVGETMAQRNAEEAADKSLDMVQAIRDGIAKGYTDLKDRAWAEVLRSSKVSAKLSAKAQQRLESDFERIKRLDFSVSNVYAFLIGLVESQGEINLQMMLDTFDEITKYHTDNTVWYCGWKSNDKHRTAGMRLKTTRFILPGFGSNWSGDTLDYGALQRLHDFDKVFALLDGKRVESVHGLADVFQSSAAILAGGERLASDYFEVRWYPKAGTVHFFARQRDLIDRLNRIVGRHREWLPPQDDLVSKDFWVAFDQAEKFCGDVVKVAREAVGDNRWRDPLSAATAPQWADEDEVQSARDALGDACLKVAESRGLHPLAAIEAPCAQGSLRLVVDAAPRAQLPLLEAA